jgi:UDP-N-acetylmuramoyl-L-alanyl-D-glutamate--2,6-diaminopimelate ligase
MSDWVSRLETLADSVPGARLIGRADETIRRIVFDSRSIRNGDLFVALPGTVDDGSRYVADAFHRGAAAAVVERPDLLPPHRSGIVVASARTALGLMAATHERHPSLQLRVIGVTGTDGKTTTSTLIASILRAAGRSVGLVSTVSAEIGDRKVDTGLHTTSPEAPDLQSYLREMVDQGNQDAVLEVTSHALAQERVVGCEIDVGVITNVTSDHLDFHGSYADYLAAKLRLFEMLFESIRKPGVAKCAIYNLDDPSAAAIESLPVDKRLSYALVRRADIQARAVSFDLDSSRFDVQTPDGTLSVDLPLPGWYNVANGLAAVATATILGVSSEAIVAGLAEIPIIPGRFEAVPTILAFDVFVDFAHTPNSLERVLAMARQRCKAKVSVVFGCAGLRDRQKRPRMGEVATKYADRVYLTAEDPRTESLADIIDSVADGCRAAGGREGVDFWREPDRAEAIERAIADAEPCDLVLITGKGHEQSMCFGVTEVPWSDRQAAAAALRRREARAR